MFPGVSARQESCLRGLTLAAVLIFPYALALSPEPFEYIGRPAASIHGRAWDGAPPGKTEPRSLQAVKIEGIYCRCKSFLQNRQVNENKGDSKGLARVRRSERRKSLGFQLQKQIQKALRVRPRLTTTPRHIGRNY